MRDMSYMQTPEYREKMRQSQLKRYAEHPMSDIQKQHIRESLIGRDTLSPEVRAKVTLSLKGRPFPGNPHHIQKGEVFSEEHRRNISIGRKKMLAENIELRKHIGESRRKYLANHPQAKEKFAKASVGKNHSKEYFANPENRKIVSDRFKQHWADPEKRKSHIKGMIESKNGMCSPEKRKIQSERFKKLWENPEYAIKTAINQGRHPNKAENKLGEILNFIYFNQFIYAGDGKAKIVLNGMMPDFIDVNNRLIVEYYGSHWHPQEDEQIRVDKFAEIGWRCLVIWDYEMKNKLSVIDKIRGFVGVVK